MGHGTLHTKRQTFIDSHKKHLFLPFPCFPHLLMPSLPRSLRHSFRPQVISPSSWIHSFLCIYLVFVYPSGPDDDLILVTALVLYRLVHLPKTSHRPGDGLTIPNTRSLFLLRCLFSPSSTVAQRAYRNRIHNSHRLVNIARAPYHFRGKRRTDEQR